MTSYSAQLRGRIEQCDHGMVFNEAQTQLYLPVIPIPPKHGIQVINSFSDFSGYKNREEGQYHAYSTRVNYLLAVFSEILLNHVYNFIPFHNSATVLVVANVTSADDLVPDFMRFLLSN